MASFIKKFTAAVLSLALFYTTAAAPVAQANIWEQRKAARESGANEPKYTQIASVAGYLPESYSSTIDNLLPESSQPAPASMNQQTLNGQNGSVGRSSRSKTALQADQAKNLPAPLLAVPYSFGEVFKVHAAKNPNAPFVLLIQDAHQIESAQRNVAQTLSHLQAKLGRRLLVGLEGSTGSFDLNQYRQLKNPKIQREVWEVLIQKSLINGAEYFGLMAEREPLLWGVEDEKLYLNNVAAYRKGLEAREETQGLLATMEAELSAIKAKLLTPELAKLDAQGAKFEKHEIDLGEFIRNFEGSPEMNSGRYPEIEKYLSLARVEKDLDFKSIEKQRNELIGLLSKKLQQSELNQLLQMSVSYRLGRIGYAEYYRSLQAMLQNAKIDLKQYKGFNAYVQYVLMSERIDFASLVGNLDEIQKATVRRLAQTPEQKGAIEASAHLRLAGQLIRQELSPEDWDRYVSQKEAIVRLPGAIKSLADVVNTKGKSVAALALEQPVKNANRALNMSRNAASSAAPDTAFTKLLSVHESFYAASHDRNVALANNLASKIKESDSPFAVLIAGGFHTPGLEKEMESRGMSYALFRPRIGKVTGSGTDYLHIFSTNRTPVEKMLLGERLFLMPPSATASQSYPGMVNSRALLNGAAVPLQAALGAEAGDIAAGEANASQIAGAEVNVKVVGNGIYEVSVDGQGDRTVFLGNEVPAELADAAPGAFRAGTRNHPVILITLSGVSRQIATLSSKVRGWFQALTGRTGGMESATMRTLIFGAVIMASVSVFSLLGIISVNYALPLTGLGAGLPFIGMAVTGGSGAISVPVKLSQDERKEIRFGTAGWRARFPSEKNPNGTFSPDRIRLLMQSAADYMKENRASFREAGLTDWRGRPTIVIGYDHRDQGVQPGTNEKLSEKAYAEEAARIFAANGIRVKLLSRPASTPLNLYEMWPHEGDKAAMMVNFTASHNPASDGGVEFFDGRTGGLADSPVSDPIVNHLQNLRRVRTLPAEMQLGDHPLIEVVEPSIDKYVSYLKDVIGVDPEIIRNSGINALFDGQNGVVGGVAAEIIEKLGIGGNVTIINGESDPEFGGRNNSEITVANLQSTMDRLRQEKRDAGVTGDGDFDRSGLMAPKADGSIRLYSGNDLASVQVYGFLKSEKERLGDGFDPSKYVVVRSIVSTAWVDAIAASFGVPQENIRLTAVGFRFLNNEIRRAKEEGKTVILSFEENGGIALGSALPYKDGLASTLYALTVAARQKMNPNPELRSMEALFNEADQAAARPDYGRYDVEGIGVDGSLQGSRGRVMGKFAEAQKAFQAAIDRGERPALGNSGLTVVETRTTDGYYFRLADSAGKVVGWMDVRASGTEPLWRVYVETVEKEKESALLNQKVYQWARDIIFSEIGGAKNAHVKTVGNAKINEEIEEEPVVADQPSTADVENGKRYWAGALFSTPIERPFRPSREDDVLDIGSLTPEQAQEFERLAVESLNAGEGQIDLLAAGASSRMNTREAPANVRAMVNDEEILSKGAVPIDEVDGQVSTYMGEFASDVSSLFRSVEQEATRAGLISRVWKNGVGFLSNDDYRAEHDRLLERNRFFALDPDEVDFVHQPMGYKYVATPEDVEKALKGKVSDEKYQEALAFSREAQRRLNAGDESAVISPDSKEPLGHGEYFHQLIASGKLLRLIDEGVKWVAVKNVDNYAAKFDKTWLRILGRFLSEGLDFQPEVSPRAPGQKGGSLIVMTDNGAHQLAEDPNILETNRVKGHVMNPTDSYWFNDAVAIYSLRYAINLYKQPGQSDQDFIDEMRAADQAGLEAIAERGRRNFPSILDVKPSKTPGAGATVKRETNMWQSSGLVDPTIKIAAIGVRGARNFPIREYDSMSPAQKNDALSQLRFLSTKQWTVSSDAARAAKEQMAKDQGRNIEDITDDEVWVTLETYQGNKILSDDLLRYNRSAERVTPGILGNGGFGSSIRSAMPMIIFALPLAALVANIVMQMLGSDSGTTNSAIDPSGMMVAGFVTAVSGNPLVQGLRRGWGRIQSALGFSRDEDGLNLEQLPPVEPILRELESGAADAELSQAGRVLTNLGLLSLTASVSDAPSSKSSLDSRDIRSAIDLVAYGNAALASEADANRAARAVASLESRSFESLLAERLDQKRDNINVDSLNYPERLAFASAAFDRLRSGGAARMASIVLDGFDKERVREGREKLSETWKRSFLNLVAVAKPLAPYKAGENVDASYQIVDGRGAVIDSEGFLETVGLEIGNEASGRNTWMVVDAMDANRALVSLKNNVARQIAAQRRQGALSPGLQALQSELNKAPAERRIKLVSASDLKRMQAGQGALILDASGVLHVKAFLEAMLVQAKLTFDDKRSVQLLTYNPHLMDFTGLNKDQVFFLLWYSLNAVFKINASSDILESIKQNRIVETQA